MNIPYSGAAARQIPRPAGENAGLRDDAVWVTAKLGQIRLGNKKGGPAHALRASGCESDLRMEKSSRGAADGAGIADSAGGDRGNEETMPRRRGPAASAHVRGVTLRRTFFAAALHSSGLNGLTDDYPLDEVKGPCFHYGMTIKNRRVTTTLKHTGEERGRQ